MNENDERMTSLTHAFHLHRFSSHPHILPSPSVRPKAGPCGATTEGMG